MITKFMKKEQNALDVAQRNINKFGLYINRRSMGGRYNKDSTVFYFDAMTERQPVKGNKKLIEELEQAGFCVCKYSITGDDGRRQYVFVVHQTIPITLAPDDGEEYIEQTERPEMFLPEIGVTYDNRGGGSYRCLRAEQVGGWTMATFVNTRSGWRFNAAGIRRYKDGTIEWDSSSGGRFEEVTV